ncbi:MAG TPA: hypothetical protein VHO69_03360, partial [Phototrophicaceae bacterium]|nr:hypothetical protein [Phototrophicaceae bacterium]
KLAQLGGELLIETLPRYLSGELAPQPQPDAGVTYAPQIKKEEGAIDWTQPASVIERLVRAFTPWPGTYTFWNGQALKIISGTAGEGHAEPGQVLETRLGLAVGTSEGLFYPTQVQLAGRKVLSIQEFVRGQGELVGARLESQSERPDRTQT